MKFSGTFCQRGNSKNSMHIQFYLQYDGIKVETTKNPLPKPDPNTLMFGKQFTDHMLEVEWDAETGWGTPQISPFCNLSLPPAASALHYAIEVIIIFYSSCIRPGDFRNQGFS